jgi:hypothetical protein
VAEKGVSAHGVCVATRARGEASQRLDKHACAGIGRGGDISDMVLLGVERLVRGSSAAQQQAQPEQGDGLARVGTRQPRWHAQAMLALVQQRKALG